MTDHFTYEEYVANVSQTSAKSLYGMLLCFDWNWKNGTMGPIFARVLREAAASRFEELSDYKREHAMGRKRAWAEGCQKRRLLQAEEEDGIVELQPMGKGGVRRYVVARSNVEAAARRADDNNVARSNVS